jgi:hypothetical protein
MKRQGLFFFSKLFGGGQSGSETKTITTKPVLSKEVITTTASQANVLQKKMKEKSLTHGETVTASIYPVRLEAGYEKIAMFFCPVQTIEISETITPGDGQDIPPTVIVEGLKVPADFKPGMYLLKNVKLSSNGTMQVIATEKTAWERVLENAPV